MSRSSSPDLASQPPRHVCAIMAVHDRRDMTVAAVKAVVREGRAGQVSVSVVVVDDGSSDGTADAVRSLRLPNVDLIAGTGAMFWAGGMAAAEEVARGRKPDYILWLNDDVLLEPGFLAVLVARSDAGGGAVAVGATRDPSSGAITYSGLRRSGRNPLAFAVVEPQQARDIDVETFNGNVVLVPRSVSESVGGIDGSFAHALADIDFGLRVRKSGYSAVLVSGFVGTCARNPTHGTWVDTELPIRARLRMLHHPKGSPPRSSARFLRRHGGMVWPVFMATPYIRIGIESLRKNPLRRTAR